MKNETIRVSIVSTIAVLCLVLKGCETAPLSQSEKYEHQASMREMASQTFEQLYASNPGARDAVEFAAGYGVFSDSGFKFLIGGGARGAGIAINNTTKQETFMKMIELQPGVGFGVAKFRVVFVFQ